MGANDRQTVALIGGGHAFGKCHGACRTGPGNSPKDAYKQSPPEDPWQGTCGTSGNGNETFTSGFEGPWTTRPTTWDNEYFQFLTTQTYEKWTGPGGHVQWRIQNATGPLADVMMTTADLALLEDDKYLKIVQEFAGDLEALGEAFNDAWSTLTIVNGNEWSPEAKCDAGTLPRGLLKEPVMLNTDKCEFIAESTPPADKDTVPTDEAYATALKALNISALTSEMEELLTDSKACWPADEYNNQGHYGPLFVRLAWHCSGSFRKTDGKGGCGGGRMRFEPERSWEDNTNLDKARALLYPLKEKYGDALTWGDLFITAGTVALRNMGTPIKQLCFGRIDDPDGTESLPLGPGKVQEAAAPCNPHNGQCNEPLGATTLGLIYVNPEGPVLTAGGTPTPDPKKSLADVRSTFERMGANDRRTVALIGGGHAFGKTHGACPNGAGKSPKEAYSTDPHGFIWGGLCGNGTGPDTYTSGFEGPWTHNPVQWDNEYFKLLRDKNWQRWVGPGGHYQWRIEDATAVDQKLMMTTADLALLEDESYKAIVNEFADNHSALSEAFDDAWFMLTTINGNRWSKESRCDTGSFPRSLLDPKPTSGSSVTALSAMLVGTCLGLVLVA
jgi:catalase (peroxidase I)